MLDYENKATFRRNGLYTLICQTELCSADIDSTSTAFLLAKIGQ